MGKTDLFREKRNFFLREGSGNWMAGVSARRGVGFPARNRHFRSCCTGGKKCVNLQVIVPGSFGARKMTQENILGLIKDSTQNAQ